jgi:hypothetical protein
MLLKGRFGAAGTQVLHGSFGQERTKILRKNDKEGHTFNSCNGAPIGIRGFPDTVLLICTTLNAFFYPIAYSRRGC